MGMEAQRNTRLGKTMHALDSLQEVSTESDRAEIREIRRWLWQLMGTTDACPPNATANGFQKSEFTHRGPKVLHALKSLRQTAPTPEASIDLASMYDWLHQILGKGTLTVAEDPEMELSQEEPDMHEPYIIINDTGHREVRYQDDNAQGKNVAQ